jgi:hypothetical protein
VLGCRNSDEIVPPPAVARDGLGALQAIIHANREYTR